MEKTKNDPTLFYFQRLKRLIGQVERVENQAKKNQSHLKSIPSLMHPISIGIKAQEIPSKDTYRKIRIENVIWNFCPYYFYDLILKIYFGKTFGITKCPSENWGASFSDIFVSRLGLLTSCPWLLLSINS